VLGFLCPAHPSFGRERWPRGELTRHDRAACPSDLSIVLPTIPTWTTRGAP
jgi:hypothetical protein